MNHIAPPSWVPPSKTLQWAVRPIMSLMVTGVVIRLPGRSRIRSSPVRMFTFKNRLVSRVYTVLAATKGSHSVTTLRLAKRASRWALSPVWGEKNHPLSIKKSAMWNK